DDAEAVQNPHDAVLSVPGRHIGYFLFIRGLRFIASQNPHFEEAAEGFRKLFWISLAKVPLFLTAVAVYGANANERGIFAVFGLGAGVVELWFALPAFRSFFEGFVYLGERNGLSVCLIKNESGKERISSLSLQTVFLLLNKFLCGFIPELSLLSVFDTMGLEGSGYNFARLYPFLLVAFLLIGFCVGGVWLYGFREYGKILAADRELGDYLKQREKEEETFIRNTLARAADNKTYAFLLFALLFAVDLVFDRINYLPDVFSGVCFFGFFACLSESKTARRGKWAAAVYALCSLAATVLSDVFFRSFAVESLGHVRKADSLYRFVELAGLFEGISLAVLLLLLAAALREKTGIGQKKDVFDKENGKSLRIFTILGLLTDVTQTVGCFLVAMGRSHVITEKEANEYYRAGQTVYFSGFDGGWLLLLIFTLAWVSYGISFIRRMKNESEFSE
ncbi:MAG: hypothetical protein MJ078_04295, partial [Clostridia bacterium]|nr:hypothetical protein [Clostridia bacterium]